MTDRTTLGVAAAFVDGEIVAGDVAIADGRIESVGVSPAGPSGLAAPGFVDLQINGFAGVDFTTAAVDDYQTIGDAMAATGVTAYQPTLISMPVESGLEALAVAAEARSIDPRIIGMHLEGPFLSPVRCGAHDSGNIIEPTPELVEQYLEPGSLTMMTIAPEQPGALEAIRQLTEAGVVLSIGHTDADAETAHAGFDAGATTVTHLFNAQRSMLHREPGVPGVALSRTVVTVSIIVDGHHLAPEVVRIVDRVAPDRYLLITDAIAATGRPDGTYPLGDRQVHVSDGEARLEDGTLAGSVLTMNAAIRNLVDLGIPLERALAAATSTPARTVNRPDLGTIAPGSVADVVVLDDSLAVDRTLVGGRDLLG